MLYLLSMIKGKKNHTFYGGLLMQVLQRKGAGAG